jgi:hypothetical protein
MSAARIAPGALAVPLVALGLAAPGQRCYPGLVAAWCDRRSRRES